MRYPLTNFVFTKLVSNVSFHLVIFVLQLNPPGGGGVLPYKGLMGLCGQPGYVFRDFCLKQGRKISDICLKQGQGTRDRAAPPHPGIYRVPPPPPPGAEPY